MYSRIARTLFGVVLAKAAIVAGWYIYQKSTKIENDWKEPEGDVTNQTKVESPDMKVEVRTPDVGVDSTVKQEVKVEQESEPEVLVVKAPIKRAKRAKKEPEDTSTQTTKVKLPEDSKVIVSKKKETIKTTKVPTVKKVVAKK
jgi:hypothetical protein